jgi:osmotically inducible protein OsmC
LKSTNANVAFDTIVQWFHLRVSVVITTVQHILIIRIWATGNSDQGDHTMTQLEQVLYTARTHTTGGRDGGASHSSDGRLDIHLSVPGTPGNGTNPEQLFASGWSACFIGAMKIAAGKMKVRIPADAAVDAEVDLCLTGDAYYLQARLNVSLPGLEREVAQSLADAAHQTCPYSKATRGNIDVVINVIDVELKAA